MSPDGRVYALVSDAANTPIIRFFTRSEHLNWAEVSSVTMGGIGVSYTPSDAAADTVATPVTRMELSGYTAWQLLRDTDVMSMAHGLEVRVPFLDHRLVEFTAHIPSAMKIQGGGVGYYPASGSPFISVWKRWWWVQTQPG